MADDGGVDDKFDPPADYFITSDAADVKSLERRFSQFQSNTTDLLQAIAAKLDRVLRNDEHVRAELADMHQRLDRALDNVDGLDVRNRLALVEEVVLPKPVPVTARNGARRKK